MMGRPVGSKNKVILKKDLTFLQEKVVKFIEEVMNGDDRAIKVQVVRDILPYIFQKRPLAVEHSGNLTVKNVEVQIVRTPEQQEQLEQFVHSNN